MIVDFEKVEFDKKTELTVSGWNNVCIEYTFRVYSGISWLLWRIAGTEHVFQIQHHILLTQHGTEINEHFILVLNTFREDYLKWKSEDFPEEWMKRYQSMFKNLIMA
jgi:hypothetical protein